MNYQLPTRLDQPVDPAALVDDEALPVDAVARVTAPKDPLAGFSSWKFLDPMLLAMQQARAELVQCCGSDDNVDILVREAPTCYVLIGVHSSAHASMSHGGSQIAPAPIQTHAESRTPDLVTKVTAVQGSLAQLLWAEDLSSQAPQSQFAQPDASSEPDTRSMVQAGLLEAEQVHAAKRDEDVRLVHQLLSDFHSEPRKLIWYEDVERRIVHGAHDPVWVRDHLVEVPPILASAAYGEFAQDGARPEGISRPLPMRNPVFIVGDVATLHPPRNRMVEISLKRIVTDEHRGLMREHFDRLHGRPLRMLFNSDELGRRLANYWGRCQVRFKLRLSRSLAVGRPIEMVLEEAYPDGLTAEQHAQLVQESVLDLGRQAPSEMEWIEHTVAGPQGAAV